MGAIFDKAYNGEQNNPFKQQDIVGRMFFSQDKLKMLRHLAETNDIPFEQSEIWFFDDDLRNINRVQKCSQKENAKLKAFLVDENLHFIRNVYEALFKEISSSTPLTKKLSKSYNDLRLSFQETNKVLYSSADNVLCK